MIYKIKFATNYEKFYNDFMDVVREFSPCVVDCEEGESFDFDLVLSDSGEIDLASGEISAIIKSDILQKKYYKINQKIDISSSKLAKIAKIKRICKVALYDVLSELTKITLPYGSLTGIRPTKLYHDILEKGEDAYAQFTQDLRVSGYKANLIRDIVKNQTGIYSKNEGEADVFINIPICPTRCVYCSFISAQLDKVKKQVPLYCDILCRELEDCHRLVKEKGYKIRSVYIGGGTPTCIDDASFERILSLANFGAPEFTVEAGRPDTITENKLKIMDKSGVTRISVNPQTFNQCTLDAIGRRHTVDDIFAVYESARKYPFDINMDLIAMLPGEDFDMFANSVDKAISLAPENITVHTLALKKGSVLKVEGYDNSTDDLASRMVDYAREAVGKAGYSPYYMYRQKYVSGNLENVGYCKEGKQCIYNIDIMEETSTIIANGAGGISKMLDLSRNALERCANPKGLDVYLARGDEVAAAKRRFFTKSL